MWRHRENATYKPRNVWGYQTLGEAWNGFSFTALRWNQPCWHLDFSVPVSWPMAQWILIFKPPSLWCTVTAALGNQFNDLFWIFLLSFLKTGFCSCRNWETEKDCIHCRTQHTFRWIWSWDCYVAILVLYSYWKILKRIMLEWK